MKHKRSFFSFAIDLLELCAVAALIALFVFAALNHLKYVPADAREIGYGTAIIDSLYGKSAVSWDLRPLIDRFPANYVTPFSFALPSYLLLPFLLQCGISIWAIKLMPLFFAAASLAVLYVVIKKLFTRSTAAITLAFLVTSSLYADNTLYALLTTEPLINALFIIGIFFLVLFLENMDNRFFALFALFTGACLSIKLSAASYYLALLIAVPIMYPPRSLELFLYDRRPARFLFFFCCGALFFILYNIITGGGTFSFVQGLFAGHAGPLQSDNSPVLLHIKQRFTYFQNMILDQNTVLPAASRPHIIYRTLISILFWGGLIANPLLRALSKQPVEAKKIIFVYLFFLVVFLTGTFSPGGREQMHLALMYPFPQLVIALLFAGIIALVRRQPRPFKRNILLSFIAGFAMLILAVRSVYVYQYYASYEEIALCFDHNDTGAFELIDYIKRRKLKPVFFLDTNTAEKFHFLSRSTLIGYPQKYYLTADAVGMFRKLIKMNKKLYVIANHENTPFPNAITELVGTVNSLEDQKRPLKLVHIFGDKENPVYSVYEIR